MKNQFRELLLARRDQLSRSEVEIKNLNQAIASSPLANAILQMPVPLRDGVKCWLAGATLSAASRGRVDYLMKSATNFITAWGIIAPSMSDKERKFFSWLELAKESDLDHEAMEKFYEETQAAIEMLSASECDFDLTSLAEIAGKLFTDEFNSWAVLRFIEGQRQVV